MKNFGKQKSPDDAVRAFHLMNDYSFIDKSFLPSLSEFHVLLLT